MKRINWKFWLSAFGVIFVGVILVSSPVFAQFGIDEVNTGLGQNDLKLIIAKIIRIALGFLGIVSVSMIMFGGFKWMTAGGAVQDVEKAQKIIVNAVVGLVIVLSSWAIVQFVINGVSDATGLERGCVGDACDNDHSNDNDGLPGDDNFLLTGMTPIGAVPIRNVVVKLELSSYVFSQANASANLRVYDLSSDTPEEVDGTVSVNRNIVKFVPNANCDEPYGDVKCFKANNPYRIRVFDGLKGSNGELIGCGSVGCVNEFTTGDLVDLSAPSVSIVSPWNGSSVSLNPNVNISSAVVDDVGVGVTIVSVDDVGIGSDSPDGGSVLTSYNAVVNWAPVTPLVAQGISNIDVETSDFADNSATAEGVSVIARENHCFDTEINNGEEGMNCGGDSEVLSYCGACLGDVCESNFDCANPGTCVGGICVGVPLITSMSPLDGAPGSYVTLTGVNFTENIGVVTLLGSDDPTSGNRDVVAGLACGAGWGDTQVIFEVPEYERAEGEAVHDGYVKMDTYGGYSVLSPSKFAISSNERPGLCEISPRQGRPGTSVRLSGVNFGDENDGYVSFNGVSAGSVSQWSDGAVDVTVPNSNPVTGSVSLVSGGFSSNSVAFQIDEAERVSDPVINSISHVEAPVGQLITIEGANFGSQVGKVLFVNSETGDTALGEFTYPVGCPENGWSGSSIVVRVPSEYVMPLETAVVLGGYELSVETSTGSKSAFVDFSLIDGEPGPGVCSISPSGGPANTQVDIYGEYLGDGEAEGDALTFYNEVDVDFDNITLWTSGHLTGFVPEDAETGPVVISSDGIDSGSVNFEVGACTVAPEDSCSTGSRCCASSLTCVLDADSCEVVVPDTNFLFEFSTGPVPVKPKVVRQCDDLSVVGGVISPTPWRGRAGGNDVCVNAIVGVNFNMDVTGLSDESAALYPCIGEGEGDDFNPCDEHGDQVVGFYDIFSDGFLMSPDADSDPLTADGDLLPGTVYELVLSDSIVADTDNGSGLPLDPISFRFTTRDSGYKCDFTAVDVIPGYSVLTEEGDDDVLNDDDGDVKLIPTMIGSDECVRLSSIGLDLDWSYTNNITDSGRTVAEFSNDEVFSNNRICKAVSESDDAVVATATLASQGLSGAGFVVVDFSDPEIVSVWPDCGSACVNGGIGAEFNIAMDPDSFNFTSVHLTKCANELCLDSGLVDVNFGFTTPVLAKEGIELNIIPASDLEAGGFYKVYIDSSVSSESGVGLVGLNDGSAYSWEFGVDNDGKICSVDRVELYPPSVVLDVVGEQQEYTVTPFGIGDSCSLAGQRLIASSYDWSWGSSDERVAKFSYPLADFSPAPGCNDSCVLSGSEARLAVCGNGKIEIGEECDPGDAFAEGDGCSDRCLISGSVACEFSCSNDIKKTCVDDFDCLSDDLCTDNVCLLSGADCASDSDCDPGGVCSTAGVGCCGDMVVDYGAFEECDDGNLEDGDGCSSSCLNEGATAVGVTCGNGSIAYDPILGGEECDDGNKQGGDGCSAVCLNEGSSAQVVAACGNGLIEIGEECDDGNSVDFDGCSSRCLYEGGLVCGDGESYLCCGNGIVETDNFEQCDGGEGCDGCILQGSSLEYSVGSVCGDGGLPGFGEAEVCEGGSGDNLIDPVQIATVMMTFDADIESVDGLYNTDISSGVDDVFDNAELNVSCDCDSSSQCPTAGFDFACSDVTSCCAPRPLRPVFYPNAGTHCRNTEVKVVFGELMDHESFYRSVVDEDTGEMVRSDIPNVYIENQDLDDDSKEGCEDVGGIWMASRSVRLPYVGSHVNGFLSSLKDWFVEPAVAAGETCMMDSDLDIYDVDGEWTEVVIRYKRVLDANREYIIVVKGDYDQTDDRETGVLTRSGAALRARYANGVGADSVFYTSSDICSLDELDVVDLNGSSMYVLPQESHKFKATALTSNKGVLEPIVGVSGYDWDLIWTMPESSEIFEMAGDKVGENEDVIALGVNGEEFVTASAIITNDAIHEPQIPGEEAGEPDGTEGRSVSDSVRADAFLCESLWPPHAIAPFADIAGNDDGLVEGNLWSNFQTYYCRADVVSDVGEAVSWFGAEPAHALTNELPDFVVVQPDSPPPGVEKEFILRHPDKAEAIGIRVVDNTGLDANGDGDFADDGDIPGFLPVNMWYQQQGFVGSPSPLQVDGYQAIQDGRTVYIGAATTDSLRFMHPKIYSISYSEGAGPETLAVYNQIVQNFKFHAADVGHYVVPNVRACLNNIGDIDLNDDGDVVSCSSSIDCLKAGLDASGTCGASQDMIRRDLARIEDSRIIETIIENYGETHRHCSATQGQVCLDDSNCPGDETCLADVPLLDSGTFIRGWATSAWPSWSAELGNELASALPVDPLNEFYGCAEGADEDTCWDGKENRFSCGQDSFVYRYERSGIADYKLKMQMEAGAGHNVWKNRPLALTENVELAFGLMAVNTPYGAASICTGESYGDSAVCGDGVIGGGEVCEIGMTSVLSCDAGVDVDRDGVSDTGVAVTTCNDSCSGYELRDEAECLPMYCGNGVVEGACIGGGNDGVACLDDSICAGGACVFDGGAAEECDDGEFNGLYGYCGESCRFGYLDAMYCGNGVIEGPEICDEDTANGLYDDPGVDGETCSWDCLGRGPYCGDGFVTDGEVCDLEVQTTGGAICSGSGDACESNEDCGGGVCGGSGNGACESVWVCVGGDENNTSCVSDDDCDGGGICTEFPTFRTRSCDQGSCGMYGEWSDCARTGSCGNGVKEGSEECDDGNNSNFDGCTNVCQVNVCGDGLIFPGVESCDLGAVNGQPCEAGYEGVCNYCSPTCTYQTVSGHYCGDGLVQGDGGEVCDTADPWRYVGTELNLGELGDECHYGDANILSGSPGGPAQCAKVGVCNGGGRNGKVCAVGSNNIFVSMLGCDDGYCVTQVCGGDCESVCPFTYEARFMNLLPTFGNEIVEGAGVDDTIEVYSITAPGVCDASGQYANPEFNGLSCLGNQDCGGGVCNYILSPNGAALIAPACSVADSLSVDVDFNVIPPPLDVVFVVDISGDMSGKDNKVKGIIKGIIDGFVGYDGPVRVGFVTAGTFGELSNASNGGYDPLYSNSQFTECNSEPYFGGGGGGDYSYDWPSNWRLIGDKRPDMPDAYIHNNVASCIKLEPTLDEASWLSAIDSISAIFGGHSAPAAGLDRAHLVLSQFPADHSRVVIQVSGGTADCGGNTGSSFVAGDCKKVSDYVHYKAGLMKQAGIKLFTVRIDDDADSMSYAEKMDKIISSDCDAPSFPNTWLTGLGSGSADNGVDDTADWVSIGQLGAVYNDPPPGNTNPTIDDSAVLAGQHIIDNMDLGSILGGGVPGVPSVPGLPSGDYINKAADYFVPVAVSDGGVRSVVSYEAHGGGLGFGGGDASVGGDEFVGFGLASSNPRFEIATFTTGIPPSYDGYLDYWKDTLNGSNAFGIGDYENMTDDRLEETFEDYEDLYGEWYGFDMNSAARGVVDIARYRTTGPHCLDHSMYSFSGVNVEDFDGMFDDILESVMSAKVYLTSVDDNETEDTNDDVASTASTVLVPGSGVSIPLPPGFTCKDVPQGLVFMADFPGSGTIEFKNFRFMHCPL